MRVYKIAFTGGPGGGKTDIINMVSEFLKGLKYNVIVNSETAREVIKSGIKPNPSDKKYTLWFQDAMIKFQSLKEDTSEIYANMLDKDVVIILYDRTLLDNFAYLNNYKDYKYLFDKNNIKELTESDKFDLVIDLSSLSNFDQFEYVNDEERLEKKEESRLLDYKTSTSYLLSRNMKVIYPTKDIREKFKIVMNYISELLNQKSTKDIISYDVDFKNTDISMYNEENSKEILIKEYYLVNELNNIEYILKRRSFKNEISYVLEKRCEGNIIESKVIDKIDADFLLSKYKEIGSKVKVEINFMYDFKKYSLILDDEYNGTLEIENSNFLTDIKIPKNIKLHNNLVKCKKCDSIY